MKHIVILMTMTALVLAGCKTTCDECTIKTTSAPTKVAAAPVPPKKVISPLRAAVSPGLPKCEHVTEYWGAVYLKLTDVNGYVYKFSCPMPGTSAKYKTRTGWYLLSSDGRIIQYQDKPKTR